METFVIVGMIVSLIVVFFLFAIPATRKNDQLCRNLRRLGEGAERGPFFYETIVGNLMVLVREDSYGYELHMHERMVASGEKKPYESIVLVISPAFTFFKDVATRQNFSHVGSWEDAHQLKLEALRLASGLSQKEFAEITTDEYYLSKWVRMTTQSSTHIFVPFSSQGIMNFEEQSKRFGQQTLESATKFLLGHIPTSRDYAK